ncbi:relaxase/mobilization nuclease domain-containing protein [Aliiroseovarius sp. S1339]|uniref:relaxase/mobilization nuclease domain-containing protein n=1 Tax=Aliiroseovarius sp. S1339 TaxID=2936990 RepID=UPI0020C0613C|nr:relaxase/mobilization nuclease domain-containing protein [Aliiroseovarius sp. S1339]MCK8463018.1 relaxase/mobilization nuclease domain-containing protein [Aliiroseovarius sp. S1339]
MLIKFFRNGQGGGNAPVNYLVAREVLAYDENRDLIRKASGEPETVIRDPLPEVLRGNPGHMKMLIDACPHGWSYRAGVISFAPGDDPTEFQQQEVIDRFEDLAFAGLDADQFSTLWVRHSHECRVELHFCTPRMELTSGRSLNVAPPGYERVFDSLRDMFNKAYGWADPMDETRRQEVCLVPEAPQKAKGREALHEWILDQVSVGILTNRDEIATALNEAGFELPRLGKNYITVKDPESGERWRLRGEIFNENWRTETTVERATDLGDRGEGRGPSRLDGWSSAELVDRYRTYCDARADYNRGRYGTARERDLVELTAPDQANSPNRDEVASDDLFSIWPCDRDDHCDGVGSGGTDQTDRIERPWDHEDQRSGGNISDFGSFSQQNDSLHDRGSSSSLYSDREGMNHGEPDSTRARIAQICGAVDRSIRNLSQKLGKLGEAMGAGDERSSDWIGRLRERASTFARSVGRSIAVLDGRRAELGDRQRQAEREYSVNEARRDAVEERLAEIEGEHNYDFGL